MVVDALWRKGFDAEAGVRLLAVEGEKDKDEIGELVATTVDWSRSCDPGKHVRKRRCYCKTKNLLLF